MSSDDQHDRHLWTDDAVSRLPLQQARAELLEEIMSTSTDTRDPSGPSDREVAERRTSRRGWLVPVAAAAAVAVLAGVATIPLWGSDDESAEPVAPATGSPTAPPSSTPLDQLVFDAPAGWTFGASESGPDKQEISYDLVGGGTDYSLDVRRLPAPDGLALDQVADEHRDVTDPPSGGTPLEVAGLRALSWSYSPTDRVVATQVVDGHRFEVRAGGMTDAVFAGLLDLLRLTDQAGFEASLPEEFVTSSERDAVVEEVLAGIAASSGQDLPDGPGVTTSEVTRYQLVADVASQYACAWFTVYRLSQEQDDDAAAAAAGRVLATARQWQPVLEVDPDGEGFAGVLWELADQAAAGERVGAGTLRDGLGCEPG